MVLIVASVRCDGRGSCHDSFNIVGHVWDGQDDRIFSRDKRSKVLPRLHEANWKGYFSLRQGLSFQVPRNELSGEGVYHLLLPRKRVASGGHLAVALNMILVPAGQRLR